MQNVINLVYCFNNISDISWRSGLLVEETRVLGENHQTVTSHWQTLSYNVVSSTLRLSDIRAHNFSGYRALIVYVVINYHTTTTPTASLLNWNACKYNKLTQQRRNNGVSRSRNLKVRKCNGQIKRDTQQTSNRQNTTQILHELGDHIICGTHSVYYQTI